MASFQRRANVERAFLHYWQKNRSLQMGTQSLTSGKTKTYNPFTNTYLTTLSPVQQQPPSPKSPPLPPNSPTHLPAPNQHPSTPIPRPPKKLLPPPLRDPRSDLASRARRSNPAHHAPGGPSRTRPLQLPPRSGAGAEVGYVFARLLGSGLLSLGLETRAVAVCGADIWV